MNDDNTKAALVLLAIPTIVIGMVLVFLPFGLFTAWAVQKMYGWFLLPLGLPRLNLWHIYGLILTINILKNTKTDDEPPKLKKTLIKMVGATIAVLLVLLVGFIIKGLI
jgi:hypothetical protein